ncbi:acyl-CoA-binding protein [Hymenobacter sp. ASUV-10]|uniref:Acyl-CoA-binding protein n=1 Tax=Hymenobacter aranciens TaxID=3063996 RepID=A0ABT9B8V1_9BACT|nr:acyl-CoA-binding protein [Hymenobacter sp. ASUV-10]MDO7874149.1 acyl-CoA-binding protein [Hymenobacter sp. ASUV-10]
MNLNEQFEAAVERVNNLPADTAPQHMTELYGLYKQATEGDVNMQSGEVSADEADKANGPAGLSQGQWDSWNQYKGLPEEEAKQRYVARAAEVTGLGKEGGHGAPTNAVATDANTNAPTPADHGGLRGDITAGAPYGGEDKLKGQQ